MAMYKCDEPGCEKYFSSQAKLRKHKERVHGATHDDAPPAAGDAPPAAGDAPPAAGDAPPATGDGLKIKKPLQETRSYECSECHTAVTKGQEVCPGCGEPLSWDGIE